MQWKLSNKPVTFRTYLQLRMSTLNLLHLFLITVGNNISGQSATFRIKLSGSIHDADDSYKSM